MSHSTSRRNLLRSLFGGFGCLGLASVLAREEARAATAGHYAGPRLPGKARHVINLVLSGGPSQVDLFDPKPALAKHEGQRPGSVDLPTQHQGTPFNNAELDPVNMIPDLQNKWTDQLGQRRQLDAQQTLNWEYSKSFGADEYLEGRIQSMESAYRMQFAALDAFDVRKEPAAIREEYGTGTFAN